MDKSIENLRKLQSQLEANRPWLMPAPDAVRSRSKIYDEEQDAASYLEVQIDNFITLRLKLNQEIEEAQDKLTKQTGLGAGGGSIVGAGIMWLVNRFRRKDA